MVDNSASTYITKVIVPANSHVCTHPSVDRCKRTTSASLIASGWATRETVSLVGSIAVEVVGTPIHMGGRHSSSTEAVEEDKDTAETGFVRNNR